jgi:hypothetical protein
MKGSYFFIFFVLLIFAFYSIRGVRLPGKHTQEYLDPAQVESILQFARDHIPRKGILKEHRDGFVYLKVSDDYIYQLFPMIKNSHYSMPAYFRRPNAPGAHISVFYVDERSRTGKIHELGKVYRFKVSDLVFVPTKSQQYIVLEVDAPELEILRKK